MPIEVDRVIFSAQLFVALSVIMAMRILYLYLTLTLKGLLFWFRLARTMVPRVTAELKNLDARQRTSIGLKQLSQTLSP